MIPRRRSRRIGIVCAAFLTWAQISTPACAQTQSDQEREKRWAAQVISTLVVGDAIYLPVAGDARFLALYAQVAPARGAVLLLHGPGLHPNHGITGELRVSLVDRGYTTLSLQMPVLPADEEGGAAYRRLYPEAAARIAAGVRYLGEKGYRRVAVVSHAMGSGMFYEYWRKTRDSRISAWAALSFYGDFDDIAGATFPVLDLYGAQDYSGIRGSAEERARVLASVRGSRQLAAPDGGYFLAGGEATVLREVPLFLDRLARSEKQ